MQLNLVQVVNHFQSSSIQKLREHQPKLLILYENKCSSKLQHQNNLMSSMNPIVLMKVDILIVTSPNGGEYQLLFIGQGITPQPKGPYKLSGAKPPAIEFKNPFFEAQEFTLRIDNPSFTSSVKSPIKVDGKKVLSINITYKAVPNTSNNGRLIISCGDLPQWVFYLQGE